MKHASKGEYGYIRAEKKRRLIIMLVMFAIPIAIFITGCIYSGTRNNILTVVAILGIIPAAKFAVDFIMIMSVKSAPEQAVRMTQQYGDRLNACYELTVTAYEGKIPLDCVVSSGSSVACLCSSGDRKLIPLMEKHMEKILSSNGLWEEKVKIFTDEKHYSDRIEQMAKAQTDGKREEKVLQVLKAISL